mgnify:CR=1 FL=1
MECNAKDNERREIITKIKHSPPDGMHQDINGPEGDGIILPMSNIEL